MCQDLFFQNFRRLSTNVELFAMCSCHQLPRFGGADRFSRCLGTPRSEALRESLGFFTLQEALAFQGECNECEKNGGLILGVIGVKTIKIDSARHVAP